MTPRDTAIFLITQKQHNGGFSWFSGLLYFLRKLLIFKLVPEVGIEPTRDFSRQILSLVRLPIPPLRPCVVYSAHIRYYSFLRVNFQGRGMLFEELSECGAQSPLVVLRGSCQFRVECP